MDDNSALIKFGKRETVLMGWRTLILLLSTVATGGIMLARGDLTNIREELSAINTEVKGQRVAFDAYKKEQGEFRLADMRELAEIRGKVTSLEGSVDVHRTRLTGLENDARTFWSKLLEFGQQRSTAK